MTALLVEVSLHILHRLGTVQHTRLLTCDKCWPLGVLPLPVPADDIHTIGLPPPGIDMDSHSIVFL